MRMALSGLRVAINHEQREERPRLSRTRRAARNSHYK